MTHPQQGIKIIHGQCAPLMLNDIDTDIIIPAQHLTQTTKSGYGQHAFARIRQADPNCVFNRPEFKHAKVLLAGDNFGCGSSREHAVWAIQEMGFTAIIAPSFADIFSNNARKNGLVLITQPLEQCQQLAAAAAAGDLSIEIDLVQQRAQAGKFSFTFKLNPFFQHCITEGHSELDYLYSHHEHIQQHHRQAVGRQVFMNTEAQLGGVA